MIFAVVGLGVMVIAALFGVHAVLAAPLGLGAGVGVVALHRRSSR